MPRRHFTRRPSNAIPLSTTASDAGLFGWWRVAAKPARHALIAAAPGWALDAFDVMLFSLTLASVIADLGLTKTEVRQLALELGLPNADKPAAPCLASRIPHFSEVDPTKLAQIERAEQALRALGLGDLRVRHHGEVARLELAADDLSRSVQPELRDRIVGAVRAAGFTFVALDLAGIQSGAFTLPLVQVTHG